MSCFSKTENAASTGRESSNLIGCGKLLRNARLSESDATSTLRDMWSKPFTATPTVTLAQRSSRCSANSSSMARRDRANAATISKERTDRLLVAAYTTPTREGQSQDTIQWAQRRRRVTTACNSFFGSGALADSDVLVPANNGRASLADSDTPTGILTSGAPVSAAGMSTCSVCGTTWSHSKAVSQPSGFTRSGRLVTTTPCSHGSDSSLRTLTMSPTAKISLTTVTP
mmetsp:Transcript_19226/g.51022  ORF Transcript_19226/g.51022 Transcript_19226/m.51022 type:complete len:228 (+) Transcript_19226:1098-1781(+)